MSAQEPKHTIGDLYQMQSLSLQSKIQMTRYRIDQWIEAYGEDGVYVSFSGGKDSTVLLDIVRKDHPRVKAMFVDTGLEYPAIRNFVKTFDNVDWIKPKMNFRQVIEKYGYPIISKEVSETVEGAKKYLLGLLEGGQNTTSIGTTSSMRSTSGVFGGAKPRFQFEYDKLCGYGKYASNDFGGGRSQVA